MDENSKKDRQALEVQLHLGALNDVARRGDETLRKQIARGLLDLASEILSHEPQQPTVAADEPHARLDPQKGLRIRRKASMLRRFLEGESIAEIARSHGITSQTVQDHLQDVLRVLKKRTHNAAKFLGRKNNLAGIHWQPRLLNAAEKSQYLVALALLEREIERRERGLPWSDIWR